MFKCNLPLPQYLRLQQVLCVNLLCFKYFDPFIIVQIALNDIKNVKLNYSIKYDSYIHKT